MRFTLFEFEFTLTLCFTYVPREILEFVCFPLIAAGNEKYGWEMNAQRFKFRVKLNRRYISHQRGRIIM